MHLNLNRNIFIHTHTYLYVGLYDIYANTIDTRFRRQHICISYMHVQIRAYARSNTHSSMHVLTNAHNSWHFITSKACNI